MNFIQTYKIEDEICDDLIDYYNNSVEYKTEGTIDSDRVDKKIKDSMDVYFLNCSTDFRIKNLFSAMNPCILDYVKRYDISFAVKTDVINRKEVIESYILKDLLSHHKEWWFTCYT